MEEKEIIANTNNPLDYTKESIKLTRNSKGYTWELKVVASGENGIYSDADFKRLKDRNIELDLEYGKESQ